MEKDVVDILKTVQFPGTIQNEELLKKAVTGSDGGPQSISYTELVSWLTCELSELDSLEETVNKTSIAEDNSSFLMEVSSFLKEIECPHSDLMEGPANERLKTEKSRLLLVLYLLHELQAARILVASKAESSMKLHVESDQAKDLKIILQTLKFGKPPPSLSAKQIFTRTNDKVKSLLTNADPRLVKDPLFNRELSDKHLKKLQDIQAELNEEYTMRRQMLIKRLDVTIQSFEWSNEGKKRKNELTEAFRSRRDLMKEKPTVHLASLLAARTDAKILEKTSSASVRRNTQTNIAKVVIGDVPDRGGRADEIDAPPKEMPSWTSRTQSSNDSYRGSHRGGQGRGSNFSSQRVQGGWNQHKDNNHGRGRGRGRGRGNYY